jgi:alpha-ribazole phosphatase
MEFVLIRHTACEAPGLCYGHLDVPLCASADGDIANTLSRVPNIDLVFSSASLRCRRLAEPLAARDGCELITIDDLRELHFGEWEGMQWAQIPRELSDYWAADPWNRAPPGGETEAVLFERVQRALRAARSRTANRIAIVAHGGPLRLLRCLILDQPIDDRWQWNIATGEVARFEVRIALPQ